MVDHSILLHILYHNTAERQVYSKKTKLECSADASLIFFPIQKKGYDAKLNGLDSMHYMLRLMMLYSMIWKCN